jgi:hypothetical protein
MDFPPHRRLWWRVSVARGAARGAGCMLALAGCTTVDPGPNFVGPDEQFDADFFFCRVEPEVLIANRCGPGDPSMDGPSSCHFNASAVSGMPLRDHPPVECDGDRPRNRVLLSPGSPAQANLQSATLVMSRDVTTAPIFVRPTGQNHPRPIFQRDDPVLDVLRQWAQR